MSAQFQYLNLPQIDAAIQQQKAADMQNALAPYIMQKYQQDAEKGALEMQLYRDKVDREKRIRDQLQAMATGGAQPAQAPQSSPAMASFAPGSEGSPKVGGPDWMQSYQAAAPQAASTQAAAPNAKQAVAQRFIKQAEIYSLNGDADNANKLYEHAAKFMPEVHKIEVAMQDGKPVNVITYKDGTQEVSKFGATPKLHFADNGQFTGIALDEYTGKQVTNGIQKQQSPDSVASNAVTMRGQNMTDSRARELNAITREGQQTQVVVDPVRGPILVNKGTGVARNAIGTDGAPIKGELQAKRENAANNLLPVLDQAEKLIDGATGSYAGAAVDKAAQVFGKATTGAKQIAQLKVLEGNIMMNQPRMEGPQSDKDVAMYRQMAGQIGDPAVPNEIKKAALNTIRSLQQKYATNPGGNSANVVDFGSLK